MSEFRMSQFRPKSGNTQETLRDFLRRADAAAVAIFNERGRLLPIFHAVAHDGDEFVFPSPPGRSKDESIAAVRAILEKVAARRYVFVDEAWALQISGEMPSYSGSLEHVPGRKEILMFSAEDEREGFLMGRREISRDSRAAAKLGPLVIDEGGALSGRMVGLLPRSHTSH